ncbi:hypothetical protein D9M71_179190 [compost metagenome]
MAGRQAQVVDRRQQQFGDFQALGFEVFQVAAQHIEGVAEGGELAVALLPCPGGNVGSQAQGFLRQQFGAHQFDQVQRAADLVQAFHGVLQQAAVLSLGNEMLEILFGLLHGGEQLVAHQTQGGKSCNHRLLRLLCARLEGHQSAYSGCCLLMCAATAACRSADCSMAAFQVAMYSRPSSMRWSRAWRIICLVPLTAIGDFAAI